MWVMLPEVRCPRILSADKKTMQHQYVRQSPLREQKTGLRGVFKSTPPNLERPNTAPPSGYRTKRLRIVHARAIPCLFCLLCAAVLTLSQQSPNALCGEIAPSMGQTGAFFDGENTQLDGDHTQLAELVEKYVNELDDLERGVRDQAEQALAALGPKILPYLNKSRSLSAEAALRVERIRKRLVAEWIEQEQNPSQISAEFSDTPLEDAVQILASQSGNRILVDAAIAEKKVNWQCAKREFWPALDELLDLLHLDVEARSPNQLLIVPRPPNGLPRRNHVTYLGPFRLAFRQWLADTSQTRQVVFAKLELSWEPRLQPVVLWWGPISARPAEDSKNGEVPLAPARREIPVNTQNCAVELILPCPLQKSPTVLMLQGKCEPILSLAHYEFRISSEELARRPFTQMLGDVFLTAEARREQNAAELILHVRYSRAEGAFASHRGWFFSWPAAYKTDRESIPPSDCQLVRMTDDGIALQYRFQGLDSGSGEFVFSVPLAIRRFRFQFALSVPATPSP